MGHAGFCPSAVFNGRIRQGLDIGLLTGPKPEAVYPGCLFSSDKKRTLVALLAAQAPVVNEDLRGDPENLEAKHLKPIGFLSKPARLHS